MAGTEKRLMERFGVFSNSSSMILMRFNLAVGGHLAVELREILVHYARKFFLVDILSAGRIRKSGCNKSHERAAVIYHKRFVDVRQIVEFLFDLLG